MAGSDVRCAGAENCRRPAIWTIVDYGHGIFLQTGAYFYPGRKRYCKRHGEAALVAERAMLSDGARRWQFDRVNRRRDVLYHLSRAISELEILSRDTDSLASGYQPFSGGHPRDAWYASFLDTLRDQVGIGRDDLAPLHGILKLLEEELRTNLPAMPEGWDRPHAAT